MINRFVWLMLAGLLLATSGCGWLTREKDPTPPTKLTSLTPEIERTRIWSKRFGKGTDGRLLRLRPAVVDGLIYLGDARGSVVAVRAADGTPVWEVDTDLRLSSGPEVGGNRLVFGSTNGDLVALDRADGSILWTMRIPSEILAVPRLAGDTLVVHALDDTIYGFDAATGEERWKFTYTPPVLTLRGSSAPLIVGSGAIIGLSGGRLVNLDIQSGLPLWETVVTPPQGRSELERIADIDADPLLVDGIVYVGTYNGDLAAVDQVSGAVLWRRTLSAHAGLAFADDILYITDSEDQVWAAARGDGSGIWKQERLKFRRVTAPTVIGSLLVVGDLDGYVHWLSRADGRILARDRVAKEAIAARPVVVGERVYIVASDGTLAVYAPELRGLLPIPPSDRSEGSAEDGDSIRPG